MPAATEVHPASGGLSALRHTPPGSPAGGPASLSSSVSSVASSSSASNMHSSSSLASMSSATSTTSSNANSRQQQQQQQQQQHDRQAEKAEKAEKRAASGRDTVREYRHALTMSNTMRMSKQRKTLTTDAVAELRRRVEQYNSTRDEPNFHLQLEETQSTVLFSGMVKITSYLTGMEARTTIMRINNRVVTPDVISALMTKYHLDKSNDVADYELFVHSRGHECSLVPTEFPLEIKLLLDTDPSFPDNNVEFILRQSSKSADLLLNQTIQNPLFERRVSIVPDSGIRLKSGYLNKRSMAPGTTRNWKVCYFVLSNDSLAYYKSSSDTSPTAVYHISQLTDIEYVEESLIRRKYCFRMACPSYIFCCAVDEKSCRDWVERLRQVRQMWDLHPEQQRHLLNQRRHWRYVGQLPASGSSSSATPARNRSTSTAKPALTKPDKSHSSSNSLSGIAAFGVSDPSNSSSSSSNSSSNNNNAGAASAAAAHTTTPDKTTAAAAAAAPAASSSAVEPFSYNSSTFGSGFPAIGFMSPQLSRSSSLSNVNGTMNGTGAGTADTAAVDHKEVESGLLKLGRFVRRASHRLSRKKSVSDSHNHSSADASVATSASVSAPTTPSAPKEVIITPGTPPPKPKRSLRNSFRRKKAKDTAESVFSTVDSSTSKTSGAATPATSSVSSAATIAPADFEAMSPGFYGSMMVHDVPQLEFDASGIDFEDDDYFTRFVKGDDTNAWEGITMVELGCFVDSLIESEHTAIQAVRARYAAHKFLLLHAIESLTEDEQELAQVRAQIAAVQAEYPDHPEGDTHAVTTPSKRTMSSKSSSSSSVALPANFVTGNHVPPTPRASNGTHIASSNASSLAGTHPGSISSINSVGSVHSAASNQSSSASTHSGDNRSNTALAKAANRLSWSGVADASLQDYELSNALMAPANTGNLNVPAPPTLKRSKSLTRSELRKSKRDSSRAQKELDKRLLQIEKEKKELEKRQKDLERRERDLLVEQERERDRQLKKAIKTGQVATEMPAQDNAHPDGVEQEEEEPQGIFSKLVRRRSTLRKKRNIDEVPTPS
ncbi:hypothetical protein CAOG_05573 [Capsaspora owczarzaki ATCC 30864]|uniref:PH domain-containing protein n=1 Tax=Capsaspora owczarzaki (strain ATCC 30864) TaxID=595528 RepID=A0A0D2UIY1_CAPO3|nr:hypothetical protein CAOG_05573 [Capsaspora owczarzaki ATCC 30864]KJE95081.1 hypothetical protein CAOG_005573 [Capsaspora owczarzaki ATCC 30864]|eukprot:XP_004346246.2 hypothetical protein CAOG_05573 [Capsaspora owczarzaki ATCC 30864]